MGLPFQGVMERPEEVIATFAENEQMLNALVLDARERDDHSSGFECNNESQGTCSAWRIRRARRDTCDCRDLIHLQRKGPGVYSEP